MPKPSVDPVRVQPPVFATGIPLPELLIPEGDFKPPTPQGNPTKLQKQPEVVVIKKLQNSFVVPQSSNSGKRPQGDNDIDIFNLLNGDKEVEEEEEMKPTVTVAILPASTTRVILPILQTTTPAPPPTTTPTTPARQDSQHMFFSAHFFNNVSILYKNMVDPRFLFLSALFLKGQSTGL